MKYRVGVSEKVTKDGRDYRVWKVSDQAGFYLADGIEGEDAEALIDKIIASCSALAVKMEDDDNPKQKDESSTKDAPQKKKKKKKAGEAQSAYLLRKRTGEKIAINKELFRLGKDAACVDYVVGGNPTISRNHADIVHKKNGYYVKDKGSLNHTFVDGKKLEAQKPVKLEPGSLLQLADEVFELIQE